MLRIFQNLKTGEDINTPRIAIIGSGLAGLTCATALKSFADIQLFEKSVFVGGRLSRYQFGEYRFNHGEQYFTVSNPLFLNIVNAWLSSGVVRPWDGWIVELDKGHMLNLNNETQRYMGYPHMQAVTDNLAHNCQIQLSTSITEIEKNDNGQWRLFDDRGGYRGLFDIVIIATAANQVANISGVINSITSESEKIDMTTCWSAMFAFDKDLNIPFDSAFVLNSPISWISRFQGVEAESNKEDCWVIHASPEWSLQYAASFRGRVMHALLDAFFEACDVPAIKPVSSNVHCWKHALPINTMGEDCLFDEDAAIGACGDWCTSPRIEGAILSGFSMADRVMKFIK
ncbi:MAG: NAD(P)-binding protein [Gammaproteobacteria bacterium]|nr:NAD(P)-binding protein [Gammaproteobacteria bacterium]